MCETPRPACRCSPISVRSSSTAVSLIPTATAVVRAGFAAPEAYIIASGGVGDGIVVAKAVALGADMAGMAGPLLRAAHAGEQELANLIDTVLGELRIAMFCTGSARIADVRAHRRIERAGIKPPTRTAGRCASTPRT